MKKAIILAAMLLVSTVLFASDNTIHANIGKKFVIKLNSNRTTGYEWRLAKPLDKKFVQLVGLEYVSIKKRIGAGGKEVWTFKAVERGKTNISFKYIRPWEERALPAKKEAFTVVVK